MTAIDSPAIIGPMGGAGAPDDMIPRELPDGTVTFLFSDIEGSTQLLERFPDLMGPALAEHHVIFERLVAEHRGVIFETVGDAVYAAFADPADGVVVALEAHRALEATDWGPIGRIACRLAVHTGPVERRGDHYFGPALFRCARLQSLGYGEQTLLSDVTASLVRDRLPKGVTLRDLGMHRLKDLSEPEHVYMLVHPDLRAAFPPPKSVDLHPNNLPTQLSSLIGREGDIAAVVGLVKQHRLVSLLGPGGVGKTRLALAAGAQLVERFADGVFFVDLAPFREAEQIALAAARAVGVRGTPTMPTSDALAAWLRPRTALLVLDNAEQIAGAGPRLLALLDAAPECFVLVTSRRPLRVRGEQRFAVEPLATDADAPAVRLFLERANAVAPLYPSRHDLALVGDICRRLDGLPLAIELAAARTAVIDLPGLRDRLDRRLRVLTGGSEDLPDRQRTLYDTVRWSYDLLIPEDQEALIGASVFEGGWTLDAWEAVCGADPDASERLIDAALVRRRYGRFGMLDTIREFAMDRFAALDVSEQRAIRDRHADWYAAWISDQRFGNPMAYIEDAHLARLVDPERANLDAAADVLAARTDRRGIRALALRLWAYWLVHGRLLEAERWIAAAAEPDPAVDPRERAWLVSVLGEFPRFSGDLERAATLKEEAIALARAAGDVTTEAALLADMSSIWAMRGHVERAREFAERAVELRRRLGAPEGIAHALQALAEVHLRTGDPASARDCEQESLTYAGRESNLQVFGRNGEAEACRRLGAHAEATDACLAAIRVAAQWDDVMLISDVMRTACALLADLGEFRAAATVLAVADRIEAGAGLVPWFPEVRESVLQRTTQALGLDALVAIDAAAKGMHAAETFELASATLRRLNRAQ